MRTKFSELAEVVRRLNNPEKCSTSGQKDFLPATSDRYELEVDGILRDAAGKLSVFLSAAEKRVAQTHKAKDSVPFHTSKTDFEKRLAAKTKEFETAKKQTDAEKNELLDQSETNRRRALRAEAQLEALEVTLKATQVDSSALKTKLKQLETQAVGKKSSVNDADEDSDLLKKTQRDLAAASARAFDLENDLKLLKENCISLESKVNSLKRSLSHAKSSSATQIAAYARRHEVKVEECATAREALESAQRDAEALRASLTQAEDKATLEKQCMDEQCAPLELRVAEMTKERDTIRSDLDTHKRKVTSLQIDNVNFESEIKALRVELSEVRGEVDRMNKKSQESTSAAISELQRELSTATQRSRDLKTELVSTRVDKQSVEDKLQTMNERVRLATELSATEKQKAAESAKNTIAELTKTLSEENKKATRFAREAVRAKSELAIAKAKQQTSSKDSKDRAWTDVVGDLRLHLEAAERESSRYAAEKAALEKKCGDSERLQRDAETEQQSLRAELAAVRADVVGARADAATARAMVEVEKRRADETSTRVKADAVAAARKEFETEKLTLRKRHDMLAQAARKDHESAIAALRAETAEKIVGAERAAREETAAARKVNEDALRDAARDADTRVARKAEEGQKLRNDLRLRIAELTQSLTDEKAVIAAAGEARTKAEREAAKWRTACAEARHALAEATKDVERREKTLVERADKFIAAEARAASETAALETARDAVHALERRVEEMRFAAEEAREEAESELRRVRETAALDLAAARDAIASATASAVETANLKVEAMRSRLQADHAVAVRDALELARRNSDAREDALRLETQDANETVVRLEQSITTTMSVLRKQHAIALAELNTRLTETTLRASSSAREAEAAARIVAAEAAVRAADDVKRAIAATEAKASAEFENLRVETAAEMKSLKETHERVLAELKARAASDVDKGNAIAKDVASNLKEVEATLAETERAAAAEKQTLVENLNSTNEMLASTKRDLELSKDERLALEGRHRTERDKADRKAQEELLAAAQQAEKRRIGDVSACEKRHADELSEAHQQHKAQTAEYVARATATVQSLEEALSELRQRHDARESRVEDLTTIAQLRTQICAMDVERDESENRREQLALKLQTKEKTQNVFGAGAARMKTQSTVDWMLKSKNRKTEGRMASTGKLMPSKPSSGGLGSAKSLSGTMR